MKLVKPGVQTFSTMVSARRVPRRRERSEGGEWSNGMPPPHTSLFKTFDQKWNKHWRNCHLHSVPLPSLSSSESTIFACMSFGSTSVVACWVLVFESCMNDSAICMISTMHFGLSRWTDMAYARVAEPQLASLNSCAVVVSFPVDLLSDGFKGMAFLLDWWAFTMSMVIAPSTQSDSALSTYYDVSNKFRELMDIRTYCYRCQCKSRVW